MPVLLVVLLSTGCGGNRVHTPNRTGFPGAGSGLSVPASQDIPRRLIIETAYTLRGSPYRWGGSSPERGFDCSGLVYFAHRKAGISIPRMSRSQLAQATRVPVDRIQPGDLLFFKIGTNRSHVGIYVGERKFIHAPSHGKKVMMGSLVSPYWRRRFYAAGHFYNRKTSAR